MVYRIKKAFKNGHLKDMITLPEGLRVAGRDLGSQSDWSVRLTLPVAVHTEELVLWCAYYELGYLFRVAAECVLDVKGVWIGSGVKIG